MAKLNASQLALVFKDSPYFIAAKGCRDVGWDELVAVISLLQDSHEQAPDALRNLYEFAPDTIAMEKSYREGTCANFSEQCNCYQPGVEHDDWICVVARRKRSETTDRGKGGLL